MAHKPRKDMIAETRAKLIAAGRKAFGEVGFADASMDSFTADVGLTRGALYHHFGDKKGLLEAVIVEMDAEMAERLRIRSAQAPTRWEGFVQEGIGYIEMALEPEVRRIMFRDAPAVLGDPAAWPTANGCIEALKVSLNELAARRDRARYRLRGHCPPGFGCIHRRGPVDRQCRRTRSGGAAGVGRLSPTRRRPIVQSPGAAAPGRLTLVPRLHRLLPFAGEGAEGRMRGYATG